MNASTTQTVKTDDAEQAQRKHRLGGAGLDQRRTATSATTEPTNNPMIVGERPGVLRAAPADSARVSPAAPSDDEHDAEIVEDRPVTAA